MIRKIVSWFRVWRSPPTHAFQKGFVLFRNKRKCCEYELCQTGLLRTCSVRVDGCRWVRLDISSTHYEVRLDQNLTQTLTLWKLLETSRVTNAYASTTTVVSQALLLPQNTKLLFATFFFRTNEECCALMSERQTKNEKISLNKSQNS